MSTGSILENVLSNFGCIDPKLYGPTIGDLATFKFRKDLAKRTNFLVTSNSDLAPEYDEVHDYTVIPDPEEDFMANFLPILINRSDAKSDVLKACLNAIEQIQADRDSDNPEPSCIGAYRAAIAASLQGVTSHFYKTARDIVRGESRLSAEGDLYYSRGRVLAFEGIGIFLLNKDKSPSTVLPLIKSAKTKAEALKIMSANGSYFYDDIQKFSDMFISLSAFGYVTKSVAVEDPRSHMQVADSIEYPDILGYCQTIKSGDNGKDEFVEVPAADIATLQLLIMHGIMTGGINKAASILAFGTPGFRDSILTGEFVTEGFISVDTIERLGDPSVSSFSYEKLDETVKDELTRSTALSVASVVISIISLGALLWATKGKIATVGSKGARIIKLLVGKGTIGRSRVVKVIGNSFKKRGSTLLAKAYNSFKAGTSLKSMINKNVLAKVAATGFAVADINAVATGISDIKKNLMLMRVYSKEIKFFNTGDMLDLLDINFQAIYRELAYLQGFSDMRSLPNN